MPAPLYAGAQFEGSFSQEVKNLSSLRYLPARVKLPARSDAEVLRESGRPLIVFPPPPPQPNFSSGSGSQFSLHSSTILPPFLIDPSFLTPFIISLSWPYLFFFSIVMSCLPQADFCCHRVLFLFYAFLIILS